MRKHLSILALWVRGTWLGCFGICLATAAVQLGLMGARLGDVRIREIVDYAEFVGRSGAKIAYAVGFTALFGWLLYVGCVAKRNTLGRLSVGERGVTGWHGVCCVGWLAIFWGVQVGTVAVGFRLFLTAADPETVSGQSLFLAVWQDSLLHWLLPVRDTATAVGVGLGLLALGLMGAADASCWRRNRRGFGFAVPWAVLIVWPMLQPDLGVRPMSWWLVALLGVVLADALWRLWLRGREAEA